MQGLCRLLNALAAGQAAGSARPGVTGARTFFERAALWGSGQGLERVKELSEKTRKGVKDKSWVLREAGAGDRAGFVPGRGCGAPPSPALLAGKMLPRWKRWWCWWPGRLEEGDFPPL